MDAHITLPSSKKQELSKDHHMDIISNLPESVLDYVLSFLSTKDVVRTSILSKRWQYLWTSVANIDLDWRSYLDATPDSFIEFVNRVITLHDDSAIKRLRLRLDLPAEFSRLNSWICVALSHNVEQLDLSFYFNQQSELPFCLFSSQSLISLRIAAKLTFKPPPSTYFIKLKKLHLSLVSFSDDVSAQRLFSNCPVLEELHLMDCDWEHIQSVSISIPTLKSLSIDVQLPSRNEAGLNCLINIFSSNITYLYWSIYLNVNICICDLPSLDRAFVCIPWSGEIIGGVDNRAGRIFSLIHNVRCLGISRDVLWSILELESMQPHIPIFHKLTHLELCSQEPPGYVQLMKFLNKTPKLENLILSFLDDSFDSEDDDFLLEVDEIPDNIPSCFGSSFKIFSISYFEGHKEEMKLARLVLRDASILQKMNLYCDGNLSKDENYRILLKNKLNELKVSESCVIELHKDPSHLFNSLFYFGRPTGVEF